MTTATIVLVHGGSATSLMWDPMLPHLRAPAIAVDLPGRRYRPADLGRIGRRDWEQSVIDDVTALDCDRVVLVGHSSGGYVIPGVSAGLPDGMVSHLVFVAATCPVEGDRPVDALTEKLRTLTEPSEGFMRERALGRTLRALRDGEPPIETNLEVIELEARMGVEAPSQLFQPMTWVGVPDVPRTYVRAMRDRVIPPDHSAVMATNAKATRVIDLDAEHDVAATAPIELARLLDNIAHQEPHP
jgi:pimeloyl-ACP methyl ester carboxylesterase